MIWLLASPSLSGGLDDDDTAKGLRLFPLFLDRWGCSFDWEVDVSEEEEESSNGSSSRERGPPANWNSSDVVEGVRYKGRQRNISIKVLSELLGSLWSTVL